MQSRKLRQRRFQVEMLNERIAPSDIPVVPAPVIAVTPPSDQTLPKPLPNQNAAGLVTAEFHSPAITLLLGA
jgi:hypothetical protein